MTGGRVVAALVAVVVGVSVGALVLVGGDGPSSQAADGAAAVSTATVQRGKLSAMVSQDGVLTYRAQPDGAPYPVVNRADGIYTRLPRGGDRVGCGHVLYRVDDRPVLLLCGAVPAYRALRRGLAGRDVAQLNRALRLRGDRFTARTERALERLQRRKGIEKTGVLAVGDAVFLPGPVRIAKVIGTLGGAARPGAPVAQATSDALHVQVNLAPSQQGAVEKGDRVRVTLPGNRVVQGRVAGFGRVAQAPTGPEAGAADATVPAFVALDDPGAARGLDRAPVGVAITTDGVRDALSVPVTALVGTAGGGFAVVLAGDRGRRLLVGVELGLFDTAGGRVQVEGALRAGDAVVVPSS